MDNAKFRFIALIMAIVLSALFLESNGQKQLQNTLEEIVSCEGKLKLTLMREWGGLEPKDQAQLFHEPSDIEVGQDGLIYILDAGNKRIQVFDNTTRFIRTIGREGKGPGEFIYPVDIAIDNQNNLVISESMNRIQILDSEGVYINGFNLTETFAGNIDVSQEQKLVLYNGGRSKIDSLFLIYDYEGNNVGKIGEPEEEKNPMLRSLKYINHFALDNQGNLCLGFRSRAVAEKYSKNGELIWQTSYELPFKVPEVKIQRTSQGISTEAEMVSAGITVDDRGRIYLATLTRKKNEEERKVGIKMAMMSGDGSYSQRTMPHSIESPRTDLFQLLVFDDSGRIIASEKLDIFCDKIKVHDDRLFVIDSYVAAKIYEYKISFE